MIYFCVVVVTALIATVSLLRMICKSSDPTQEEIDKIDAKSLNQITMVELDKLNKQLGDEKLPFGLFMVCYLYLNWRTEFEPDDVFSQKTAVLTYLFNLKSDKDSYQSGGINHDE
jgi:hypothetical protein